MSTVELAAFDVAAFLRDHWQQRPLLIKNPWREWSNPLAPDELAGLACEEGVESRLVTQTRGRWQLEHGPLPESRFARLPKNRWTLLVQAVDHHVPEVASLLEPFRFLPNWRLDDVMVSYAADQGGVGPHFDQYDVFLLQGLGRRRWQVGKLCDHSTALLPHDDLRLLADFDVEQEWLLEPGDMLYLPPRYAHNGIAEGDDCMTYSIGLRAPGRSELLAHWCDHVLAELSDDDRFVDPQLAPTTNPGVITEAALDQLQRLATEKLLDRAAFRHWFGCYGTTRKYPDQVIAPARTLTPAKLRQRLERDGALLRNGASRFACIAQTLFVDGEAFHCEDATMALALQLCAQPRIAADAAVLKSAPALALLTALYNQGSLLLENDA